MAVLPTEVDPDLVEAGGLLRQIRDHHDIGRAVTVQDLKARTIGSQYPHPNHCQARKAGLPEPVAGDGYCPKEQFDPSQLAHMRYLNFVKPCTVLVAERRVFLCVDSRGDRT